MILFPQNLDKRACERKFCQYSVGLFQKFLIISPENPCHLHIWWQTKQKRNILHFPQFKTESSPVQL